ncbi:hypothetical protein PALA111701_25590 [Paenibacillus lactis]
MWADKLRSVLDRMACCAQLKKKNCPVQISTRQLRCCGVTIEQQKCGIVEKRSTRFARIRSGAGLHHIFSHIPRIITKRRQDAVVFIHILNPDPLLKLLDDILWQGGLHRTDI